MSTALVCSAGFLAWWGPVARMAAEALGVEAILLGPDDRRSAAEVLGARRAGVQRLLCCGCDPGPAAAWPDLNVLGLIDVRPDAATLAAWRERGVLVAEPRNEGFWGQSVAEFALGLTLAALRRIPQSHAGVLAADPAWWDYSPRPGSPRCGQFGDDPRFANGTLHGKRVGVIGLGNIGARYASWCAMMGAEVRGWDLTAPDPCFHRSDCRRLHRLEDLVSDCDILAPMVPLREGTRGLVRADLVDRLPRGALVVLVTRAEVVDMPALRRRVVAGELALAADVFDREPLPADDPLVGLPQVVLTPHNAGRTLGSCRALLSDVLDQWPR
jgi:phosphoglycerate dehydrogenase-like enzyme